MLWYLTSKLKIFVFLWETVQKLESPERKLCNNHSIASSSPRNCFTLNRLPPQACPLLYFLWWDFSAGRCGRHPDPNPSVALWDEAVLRGHEEAVQETHCHSVSLPSGAQSTTGRPVPLLQLQLLLAWKHLRGQRGQLRGSWPQPGPGKGCEVWWRGPREPSPGLPLVEEVGGSQEEVDSVCFQHLLPVPQQHKRLHRLLRSSPR